MIIILYRHGLYKKQKKQNKTKITIPSGIVILTQKPLALKQISHIIKMQEHICPGGCCRVQVEPRIKDPFGKIRRLRRKAGVFLYSPRTDRVLMVQSNGNFWGIPKGTMEYGETERQCAVREVYEETGLVIDPGMFTRAVNIRNRALYYYMEVREEDYPVQLQTRMGNDANGVGWIKTRCLRDWINNGNITLSQHCRIAYNRFFSQ